MIYTHRSKCGSLWSWRPAATQAAMHTPSAVLKSWHMTSNYGSRNAGSGRDRSERKSSGCVTGDYHRITSRNTISQCSRFVRINEGHQNGGNHTNQTCLRTDLNKNQAILYLSCLFLIFLSTLWMDDEKWGWIPFDGATTPFICTTAVRSSLSIWDILLRHCFVSALMA